MARIDDFGEHLSGAAKERWRGYRTAMDRARREVADPAVAPLSESFPEPPYKRLVEDGADPWVIAFVRAAREQIPTKPRSPYRAAHWAVAVRALRDLAADLIEGSVDRARIETRLTSPAFANLREGLEGRTALYEVFGHERSLRGFRLTRAAYTMRDGVRHDPPQLRWEVVRDRSGRKGEVLTSELTREAALSAFRERLNAETGQTGARRPPIEIYGWRGQPERGVVIGVKNGKHLIELARLPNAKTARAHLAEHRDALERRLAELRDLPPERGDRNRDRQGPDQRGGDVSPENFLETFGFRGVQFGNYVEGPRRQAELNRAYDALTDLAEVLGCAPCALSLGGTLGLAFGARGRGGKGAAAAHYEPDQVVINLTKTNGAGSLAHEWFHALDNHLARRAGGRTSQYATELKGAGEALIGALSAKTRLRDRSLQLDRVRSSPYFSTRIEMAARGFEAFVIDRLAERGVVNDYLANVIPQDAFEAVAALRGQPPGGYPYPLGTEMGPVRAAYAELLASRAVSSALGPARDPEGRRDPVRREPAAGPEPETENGPERRPGPSETPDFEWC
jgi:hypothetical protein